MSSKVLSIYVLIARLQGNLEDRSAGIEGDVLGVSVESRVSSQHVEVSVADSKVFVKIVVQVVSRPVVLETRSS